ncbi:hypothetical protein ACOSQ2_007119 [Xanthoceras sorbifolium]
MSSRSSGSRRSGSDSNKENVHVDLNRRTQEDKGRDLRSVSVKEGRDMEFQFVSKDAVGNFEVVKNKSELGVENILKEVVLGPSVDKEQCGSNPNLEGQRGLKVEYGGSMAVVEGSSVAVVYDSVGGSLCVSGSDGSGSSDDVGSVAVVGEVEEATVTCSLDGQGVGGKLKRWKRLARDKAVGMSEAQQSLGKRMGQDFVGDVNDQSVTDGERDGCGRKSDSVVGGANDGVEAHRDQVPAREHRVLEMQEEGSNSREIP